MPVRCFGQTRGHPRRASRTHRYGLARVYAGSTSRPIVWIPGLRADERGRKLSDTDFLVLLNSHHEDLEFSLPAIRKGSRWIAWMDTSREAGLRPADTHDAGTAYPLQARSMVVLMERHGNGKKEESKEETNEAPS